MTGPVEWLEQKLNAAEGQAQAATSGPWFANEYDPDWDVCGFEASIGTCRSDGRWPDGAADVVGHGYEGGGVARVADAQFIAAFPPDVALRLMAGARQILAEHAAKSGACAVCVDRAHSGPGRWALIVYPCRTVRLLAEAWGWEETT